MKDEMRSRFCNAGVLQSSARDYKIAYIAMVPLIYLAEINGQRMLVAEWYDEEGFDQHQFPLFETRFGNDSRCVMCPEAFRTMYLGRLKDFPRDNVFYPEVFQILDTKKGEWIVLGVAPPLHQHFHPVGPTKPLVLISKIDITNSNQREVIPEAYYEPGVYCWASTVLDKQDLALPDKMYLNEEVAQIVFWDAVLRDFRPIVRKAQARRAEKINSL